MDNFITKQRLAEQQSTKFKTPPNKYILCITTPTKAYVIEGRKDFSEHNNREATNAAWFEFLLGLTRLNELNRLNVQFRLTHFPPGLHVPDNYYGLTMKHLQDGTICFGGRILSNCVTDNRDTTIELIEYFQALAELPYDQVRAHLDEFGFGVYDT